MTVRAVATGRDYPQMIAETDHVEPAPRRVRGMLGGEQVFDTTRARYVWEWAYYPQYYIPVDDIDPRFLVDEHHGSGSARARHAATACARAAGTARAPCGSSATTRSRGGRHGPLRLGRARCVV